MRGPADWLLANFLSSLLQLIPVHIGIVYDLLERLKQVPRQASTVSYHAASFGIGAFHTTVDNAAAVRALKKMLDQHSEDATLFDSQ